MKKNTFEIAYTQVQELKKAYNAATDEDEKKKIGASYAALMEGIKKMGAVACRIWREYKTARDNGNIHLDISDVVWDKDVEELISCMKKNGISEFTFSSTWSSAVETAWLFVKNGCKMDGLVEINGSVSCFTEEHEKKHGYLFKIN